MKVLVLDNYDSFTYNLVHLVGSVTGVEPVVRMNDELQIEEVAAYSHIILSPGPGLPGQAGIMMQLIREYGPTKKILGVCLGHQGIAEAYGASLFNLPAVYHGVAMACHIQKPVSEIFKGLDRTFAVGRYHSWMVAEDSLPACFKIIARDDAGQIMGLQHKQHSVTGLQFHPESILTEGGKNIMSNWIFQ